MKANNVPRPCATDYSHADCEGKFREVAEFFAYVGTYLHNSKKILTGQASRVARTSGARRAKSSSSAHANILPSFFSFMISALAEAPIESYADSSSFTVSASAM